MKLVKKICAQIELPLQINGFAVFFNTVNYHLMRTGIIHAVATDGESVMIETKNCQYIICGDSPELKKHNFKLALGYDGTVTVHGTLIQLEQDKPAQILTKLGMMQTSSVHHYIVAPSGDVTITTRSNNRYIVTSKPL